MSRAWGTISQSSPTGSDARHEVQNLPAGGVHLALDDRACRAGIRSDRVRDQYRVPGQVAQQRRQPLCRAGEFHRAVLRSAFPELDRRLIDLGSDDGRRYDVRRRPARHPDVRGGISADAQYPVGADPDSGADATGIGRLRLEDSVPSAVRSRRLSLQGDHGATARPSGQSIHRARHRRLRRRLAMVAVLLGDHPASARKPAAGAARGCRARSCAGLGALCLCCAADAQGPADQPRLRQDDRVLALVRPDLRDDARRPRYQDRDARHVCILAGLHRIRQHLLCIEHGRADDGRHDDRLHRALETGARVRRRRKGQWLAKSAVALAAAMAVIPALWTLLNAFKDRVDIVTPVPLLIFHPTLDNILYVLGRESVTAGLVNSILISGASVLIGMVLGLPAANAVARYPTKWADEIQFFVLSLRFLPPVAVAIPLMVIWLDLGLYDSRTAMIATYTLLTLSSIVWLAVPAFKRVPKEVEEAAVVDGYGPYAVFFLVALPIASRSLIGAVAFSFVLVWNEFLIALMLTTSDAKTLPIVASELTPLARDVPWGILNASVILLSLPPLLFIGILSG